MKERITSNLNILSNLKELKDPNKHRKDYINELKKNLMNL